MHTNNIITLLKAKETALNAKIRETEKKHSSKQSVVMEVLGMKLRNRILKNVCNALWMLHLLKTSLLITKTPLTTLKCLPKAMFSQLSFH